MVWQVSGVQLGRNRKRGGRTGPQSPQRARRRRRQPLRQSPVGSHCRVHGGAAAVGHFSLPGLVRRRRRRRRCQIRWWRRRESRGGGGGATGPADTGRYPLPPIRNKGMAIQSLGQHWQHVIPTNWWLQLEAPIEIVESCYSFVLDLY
jgi:hypothetical protein